MDVTIRRATAGDAEGIAKLFNDYRLFFGEPSDLPLAQDFIADRLHHTDSVIFFAQTPKERCVGFAQLISEFLLGFRRSSLDFERSIRHRVRPGNGDRD